MRLDARRIKVEALRISLIVKGVELITFEFLDEIRTEITPL